MDFFPHINYQYKQIDVVLKNKIFNVIIVSMLDKTILSGNYKSFKILQWLCTNIIIKKLLKLKSVLIDTCLNVKNINFPWRLKYFFILFIYNKMSIINLTFVNVSVQRHCLRVRKIFHFLFWHISRKTEISFYTVQQQNNSKTTDEKKNKILKQNKTILLLIISLILFFHFFFFCRSIIRFWISCSRKCSRTVTIGGRW